MMSSKRKFSDFKTEASGSGSGGGGAETREQIPGFHPPKRHKKKNGKNHKAKPDSMNWVKKRARTIERRFKTGQNMPANVENDLERELAHHKQKLSDAADDKKRKTMLKKYHMVRFFERKKADRLAKQIRSQLEKTEDENENEIKKLKSDLHTAEMDSLYAINFPYRERYVSLYPVASLGLSVHGGEKPEDASTAAQALQAERPPLWREIERASKKGHKALVEIRERKLPGDSRSKPPKEQPSKHTTAAKPNDIKAKTSFAQDAATSRKGKGKRQESSDSSSDSDSDSDGGFFEKEKEKE